jgi:hypothetical protein
MIESTIKTGNFSLLLFCFPLTPLDLDLPAALCYFIVGSGERTNLSGLRASRLKKSNIWCGEKVLYDMAQVQGVSRRELD